MGDDLYRAGDRVVLRSGRWAGGAGVLSRWDDGQPVVILDSGPHVKATDIRLETPMAPRTTDIVGLPREAAAWLVAGHVHILWNQWANEDDDDLRGCCPVHCGPCGAIQQLLEMGWLDELYRNYIQMEYKTADPAGDEVWDAVNDQVGRGWLLEALRSDRSCCQ